MKIDLCKIFGVEEGEEFKVEYEDHINDCKYRVMNNIMEWSEIGTKYDGDYYPTCFSLNDVLKIKNIIKLPKKKKFTKDELHIFKMIPKVYKWCARDRTGNLFVYESKPYKGDSELFWNNDHDYKHIKVFNHLFKSILWEDKEPIYIPDYVER